ncbi:MAG: two-component sensor histidine kinase, partial [Thiomonas sp. 20-64-5]
PQLILHADRMLLQRALANLIGNALAHTPRGGTVTLSAQAQANGVRIEVLDTGCGIAAEHLPYLFDRFYRADAARSRGRGGLGLGLALVRNIVRLHGGEISVESRPGHGTRMMLDWPLR